MHLSEELMVVTRLMGFVQTNGANCECNGRVWRMDVGMSKGVLDAAPQVGNSHPQCIHLEKLISLWMHALPLARKFCNVQDPGRHRQRSVSDFWLVLDFKQWRIHVWRLLVAARCRM